MLLMVLLVFTIFFFFFLFKFSNFQINGDLKAIWAEHLHTRHEIIVVYFDVRDAYRLVLKAALAIQESDPFYGTWVTYCTADQMSKIHGINLQINSEFMVRISGPDLSPAPEILSRFGSLQSLCPNPLFYSDRQVFAGEYFDERSAIKATQELHNHIIQVRRTTLKNLITVVPPPSCSWFMS
jgi:hypothetical protein